MQIKKLYVLAVGLGSLLLLTVESALAHHSFAVEYDSQKPVELQGKLTKVELMNPHSWLTLEVLADDGTTQTWEVEAGAPNGLYRRGFTRDSLPVGTEVVVRGYQARADNRTANGGSIRVVDGTETFLLGGSNPGF
jgi:hypothetical protein